MIQFRYRLVLTALRRDNFDDERFVIDSNDVAALRALLPAIDFKTFELNLAVEIVAIKLVSDLGSRLDWEGDEVVDWSDIYAPRDFEALLEATESKARENLEEALIAEGFLLNAL